MKKGFTIIEVSILFVIFIIVAFLVAPLSVDDTIQAKNISKWRNVQQDFVNMFYSVNLQKSVSDKDFKQIIEEIISKEIKDVVKPYKIVYLNGTYPSSTYRFFEYKSTYSNATLAYKFFESPQNNLLGVLLYDINGKQAPNVWGKDVFGFNIYDDRFEPFGKNESVSLQSQDCSKNGTGLYCSNYFLLGGDFD